MRITILVVALLWAACSPSGTGDHLLVTVKRNYAPLPKGPDSVSFSLSCNELFRHAPELNKKFTIVDQNFGTVVPYKLIDTDGDGESDEVDIDFTFESNEPVFSFLIHSEGSNNVPVEKGKHVTNDRFTIEYLTPYNSNEASAKPKPVAVRLVESTMNRYPDVAEFPIYNPRKWNYEYSFFMAGVYKLGKLRNDTSYIHYARTWLDDFIAEEGGFKEGVYAMNEYKLDDILPGRLVLNMYDETKRSKYKAVADTLISQLQHQPRTSDGGYWHKQIYTSQMWLDGIFMGDVFSMQYAKTFDKPEWYDEAVHQIELIYKHTHDPTTGLLYHGWDEAKNPVWADPVKGTSPEFWGRAVGWYMVALAECLEYLPKDHPEYEHVVSIFQDVAKAVKNVQDKKSKLWYQVLDKGQHEGNWIETSCSAMFIYAFAKGHQLGLLGQSYWDDAEIAFESLMNNYVYVDDEGNLRLDQTVKVGTLNIKSSKGDFDYYVTTERRIDDYKGLAALLYASIELNK